MKETYDYNYKLLADAIVGQAVIDYCEAGNGARGKRIKRAVKRFVKSDWFTFLTDIDPDFLIERMDKYSDKHVSVSVKVEEVA